MWYSATKVGILEIDMDHSNIDTMLQLYFHQQAPSGFLENIVDGLIRHFVHEEDIIDRLGHPFPEGHKIEHQRLTGILQERIADWKAGSVEGTALAEEIRSLLLLHVAEYDVKLADL